MARPISKRGRQSFMSEESELIKVFLLTLTHRSLPTPIYVSSDPTVVLWEEIHNIIYGTVSNGIQYLYTGFQCSLLNDEQGSIPQAQLTIPNAHRSIIESIEKMGSGAVNANIKLVFADTPDVIEYEIDNLTVSKITYDETTITGVLSRDMLYNEPWPARSFTPQEYPFLFLSRPLG